MITIIHHAKTFYDMMQHLGLTMTTKPNPSTDGYSVHFLFTVLCCIYFSLTHNVMLKEENIHIQLWCELFGIKVFSWLKQLNLFCCKCEPFWKVMDYADTNALQCSNTYLVVQDHLYVACPTAILVSLFLFLPAKILHILNLLKSICAHNSDIQRHPQHKMKASNNSY